MNLFRKISDWATNNSVNYTQENEVYTKIVEEMESIYNLLDIALTSEFALGYPITFDGQEITLTGMQAIIEMQKNRMYRETDFKRAKQLQEEVKHLEEAYRKFYELLKDTFLRLQELYEVQEHVLTMNSTIYQNARLEVFENIEKGESLLTKQWTIKELENLRNKISERRCIIIPYLGEIERRK